MILLDDFSMMLGKTVLAVNDIIIGGGDGICISFNDDNHIFIMYDLEILLTPSDFNLLQIGLIDRKEYDKRIEKFESENSKKMSENSKQVARRSMRLLKDTHPDIWASVNASIE